MTRTGKIILAIVLVIVIPGGIALAFFLFSWKPKILIEEINYFKDKFKDMPWEGPEIIDSRYVDFKMTAGGKEFWGRKFYSDKATSQQIEGKYKFMVSSEGNGFVLVIFKDNVFVKGTKIDLITQTVTEMTNLA